MRMMLTPDDIRRLRHEMKMTLAEFGKLIGVSESSVSRWENGVKHPRYSKMVMLHDLHERQFGRTKAGVA